jgi:hypothetical protein
MVVTRAGSRPLPHVRSEANDPTVDSPFAMMKSRSALAWEELAAAAIRQGSARGAGVELQMTAVQTMKWRSSDVALVQGVDIPSRHHHIP